MVTKMRKRRKRKSIAGYFKAILAERPELLHERSNDELYKLWLADHPKAKEVPLKVKQGLSNVKSTLRNKKGGKKSKALALANGVPHRAGHLPASALEKLELQIDECIYLARDAAPEALDEVINDLRKARNIVIWKQGR